MKNDGGPAFPIQQQTGPNGDTVAWADNGMTLRDYFAAAALQGYLAAHSGMQVRMPPPDKAAESAYAYADAMLAERAKP